MTNGEKFWWETMLSVKPGSKVLDLGQNAPLRLQSQVYKDLFSQFDYLPVDLYSEHADVIKGDAHNLPFDDQRFDFILCESLLEHTEAPSKVAAEMWRVLVPGGHALVTLPFLAAYHGNSIYKDYWRFTDDGIRFLFRAFEVELAYERGLGETVARLIPHSKYLRPVVRLLDRLRPPKHQTSAWFIYLTKKK